MVVADTCAVFVNDVFAHYTILQWPTLILGAVFFAFQIYGDFSGYSDIAIGTARLFGIQLMTNFKTPYFSRDIAEFWRRWHIPLSNWFRDYSTSHLAAHVSEKWKTVRNTFVIFLVSGFWHGANWTFMVWGLIHALLFLPLSSSGTNRKNLGDIHRIPTLPELGGILVTFAAVTVAWVFFRADSISDAFGFLGHLIFGSGMGLGNRMLLASSCIGLVLFVDAILWLKPNILILHFKVVRWTVYALGIFGVLLAWSDDSTQFIYFQF